MVEGRWVEKAGQRRRRYYRLTPAGRKRLASERAVWQNFFVALDRVAGLTRPRDWIAEGRARDLLWEFRRMQVGEPV
jgi:DNA-binding PadR family transcriptional regulator